MEKKSWKFAIPSGSLNSSSVVLKDGNWLLRSADNCISEKCLLSNSSACSCCSSMICFLISLELSQILGTMMKLKNKNKK